MGGGEKGNTKIVQQLYLCSFAALISPILLSGVAGASLGTIKGGERLFIYLIILGETPTACTLL